MIAIRHLLAAIAFVSGAATPGFAQIFWQNNSSAAITDDIWSVAYANGTFVATTAQGNVLTSVDGLAWTSQSVSAGTGLTSATFGKGTWVVVGVKGTILLSADLKSWVTTTSGTTNNLNGVCFDGFIFGAVGDNGTILVSSEAHNWTIVASGVTGSLRGISYVPLIDREVDLGSLMISGQNGALFWVSDQLEFAMPVQTGTTQDLEAALYQSNPASVLVGSGETIIGAGSLVTPASLNPSVTLWGLAYGNGCYVTVGDQGTILSSPDSVTWTQRLAGNSSATLSTATLLGAAFSPISQRFVVVGTGGSILTSTPIPPTVFANVSTRGTVSSNQALIGGFVIEGSAPRTVLIRSDGPVLSEFGVPAPLPDPVLLVYDSNGKVVGSDVGWTLIDPAAISAAAQAVGAFALPNPSKDSAIVLTLNPGAYTVVITSDNGNTGTALFEAYIE